MGKASRIETPHVFKQFLTTLEMVLEGPGPASRLALLLLGVIAAWWVYVPVHELLHAAGCALGGGRIDRLEISPLYGGQILSWIFPFVVAGGEYAGRLSGFDTGGNDGIHILTVALPYVVAPFGFFLMGRAARRRSPLLFGVSTPLAFSPLISVTGDFLELGGLFLFRLWPDAGCAYRGFVSDDAWRLAGRVWALRGASDWSLAIPLFALFSQVVGVLLAWSLFRCSAWIGGVGRASVEDLKAS